MPTFPTLPTARLTSPFGWRTHPVTGAQSFHYGIDLAPEVPGTTGVPIFAAASGVVKRVATHENMGLYIYLQHSSDSYMTHYLHLASALVSVNDIVVEGQQIGVMGKSGRVTGIHLDFGVSTQYPSVWYPAPGSYVDPQVYLVYAEDPPENPEWTYEPGWDPDYEWDAAYNIMIRKYKSRRRR